MSLELMSSTTACQLLSDMPGCLGTEILTAYPFPSGVISETLIPRPSEAHIA
jgi:hypothetical protein